MKYVVQHDNVDYPVTELCLLECGIVNGKVLTDEELARVKKWYFHEIYVVSLSAMGFDFMFTEQ